VHRFCSDLVFTVISLWVHPAWHYHWQAPGYLMLFPLLGRFVAQKLESGDIHAKRWLVASVATMFLIFGVMTAEPQPDRSIGCFEIRSRSGKISPRKDSSGRECEARSPAGLLGVWFVRGTSLPRSIASSLVGRYEGPPNLRPRAARVALGSRGIRLPERNPTIPAAGRRRPQTVCSLGS
jgi:hypothetical protein